MKIRFLLFYLVICKILSPDNRVWSLLCTSDKSVWLFLGRSIETESLVCLGNILSRFMKRFFLMAFSKPFKRLKESCCWLLFLKEFSEFAPLNVTNLEVTWYVTMLTLIIINFKLIKLINSLMLWLFREKWYYDIFPKLAKNFR
jgi:hypothetical protein